MMVPVRGADVSMTEEVESLGGAFRADGRERELFGLLAESGVNTVRLRTWVDPYDETGAPYMGGTNDLEATVRLARRAGDSGLGLLLDLHYSDFWADPKKQSTPKSWRRLTGEALEAKVHEYTAEVLARLDAEGLAPEMVQVGNEITNGMLWPEGRTPRFDDGARAFGPDDEPAWDRLAGLLKAGLAAVPEGVRSVIHLDFGGANELYRGWFDRALARGVDCDVIGLSYYPFWHGTLDDLSRNMNDIATRYGKDVLVVETACAHTEASPEGHRSLVTPELVAKAGYPADADGQARFLRDLYAAVAAVPNGHGLGAVYWEPAWLPVDGTTWASRAGMEYGDDVGEGGNGWAGLTLFDFDGDALPALRALGGA
ncbi:glycoside hydrolase family 53 protein [Glycomyces tenuis]|uniref:glycoside hydrolase family 53 protein n=1 Tax=Glycomyces tenuis TaxID=58116 RepID=UPI000412E771|nr:glycosyl hydrolase 53 family protein [Glycomyces tenuis]